MQKQQKAITAHTTTIRNKRLLLFMALMPYTPGKHFCEYLQLDLMLVAQHITPALFYRMHIRLYQFHKLFY